MCFLRYKLIFSDAYFCVGFTGNHSARIVQMALDAQRSIDTLGLIFQVRMGIACGDAHFSVMGNKTLTFDCFGPAVEAARQMKKQVKAGQIGVTHQIHDRTSELFYYEAVCNGYVAKATKQRVSVENASECNDVQYQTSMTSLKPIPDTKVSKKEKYGYNKILLQFYQHLARVEYFFHNETLFATGYRFLLANQIFQTMFCFGLFLAENYSVFVPTVYVSVIYMITMAGISLCLLSYGMIARCKWISVAIAVFCTFFNLSVIVVSVFIPSRGDITTLYVCYFIDWTFRWCCGHLLYSKCVFCCIVTIGATMMRIIIQRNWYDPVTDAIIIFSTIVMAFVGSYMAGRNSIESFVLHKHLTEKTAKMTKEQEFTANLSQSLLPQEVAFKINMTENSVFGLVEQGSVCFLKVDGFCSEYVQHPETALKLLNDLFNQLDALCEEHRCQKVKSIQQTYMCVSTDTLKMNYFASECLVIGQKLLKETTHLTIKIGLATGWYISGVLGKPKYMYDVFGETVNEAFLMMCTANAYSVNACPKTRQVISLGK